MAIKRASIENIPVILGSATPSLESLQNTANGRHQLLHLTKRIGQAALPEIQIVDVTRHVPEDGISQPVYKAIAECLDRKEQAIIYINRRGYAPVIHCYQCQWQAVCNQCSARLTYHRAKKQFRCHHCGFRQREEENCPECETPLFFGGAGTQRVEQALLGRFPHARFCRLDRDQANTTRKLYQQLEDIRLGKVDLIIGTQLITKGHDFSRVSLVCILNADQGLFSADFRAPELMFQQLLQVAGRAGRASNNGQVLLQTAYPLHPCIRMVCEHDYQTFADSQLVEREQAGYPPFGYFALFRSESVSLDLSRAFLEQIAQTGRQLAASNHLEDVQIFSPVPSPMEKLSGRFRLQLLVRSQNRARLHQLLSLLTPQAQFLKRPASVRWSLDVDPMDMS